MRSVVLAVTVVLISCQVAPMRSKGTGGSLSSLGVDAGGGVRLVLVTTVESCFSCRMHGGFLSLRTAQRMGDGLAGSEVTALLVSGTTEDASKLAMMLSDERIRADIRILSRRQTEGFFGAGRFPAIYLFVNDTLQRRWESITQGGLELRRDDIVTAIREVAHGR